MDKILPRLNPVIDLVIDTSSRANTYCDTSPQGNFPVSFLCLHLLRGTFATLAVDSVMVPFRLKSLTV